MGKIRVRVLGDEASEKVQQEEAKKRRETKKALKDKEHVKGVGLKGGQQIKMVEGVELKPDVEAMLNGETGEEKSEKKARKIKVRVRSKRYLDLSSQVDRKKHYPLKQAVELVKKTSTVKFDATVEAHVNLAAFVFTKEKTSLSGTVVLPHGTGKKRRIKIADDSVIENVQKGTIDFDVLVAHPSMMPKLAKVARILGPKGLMPNPKIGTVTPDPEKRAKELEGGEVNWKTEPDHPVVHQIIGKVSFTQKQLEENLKKLLSSIGSGKVAKITLSSSMGPGIKVDSTNL